MDFSELQIVAYFIAYAATIRGIWFLFEKTEETIKPKTRRAISNWLKNLNPKDAFSTWPSHFAFVFDRIFGERHFSWRCFFRSAVMSLIIVFIFFTLSFSMGYILFSYRSLFLILLLAIPLNFVPDYVSLLESRFIIKMMEQVKSNKTIVVLLFSDLIITYLIGFSIWIILTTIAMSPAFESPPPGGPDYFVEPESSTLFENLIEFVHQLIDTLEPTIFHRPFDLNWPLSIFFYTTFATSIWASLFVLSGKLAKFTEHLETSMTWFKKHFDISNKPLRSMALVSILIVTIIFFVVPFLRYSLNLGFVKVTLKFG